MGHVFAEIELSNPREPDLLPVTAKALADTGALMLCIPEHIALQLKLEAESMREVSVADGRSKNVPYVGPKRGTLTRKNLGGNIVILDIGDGIYAVYAHIKKNSIQVNVGDRVKKGEVLAKLGNTGNSGGPHLHFQLEKNGRPVDPMPYLRPYLDQQPPPPQPNTGYVFAPSTIPTNGRAGQYGLNIRSKPTITADLLGYLPPGTTFTITGPKEGAYYPITIPKEQQS